MKKQWIIFLAMAVNAGGALAQGQDSQGDRYVTASPDTVRIPVPLTARRLVVVDVETLAPVVGANVVGKEMTLTTDSMGVVDVPESSKSLAFSHVNYESRIINTKEVRDTVYMISKLLNLKEVVVFGKGKKRDYSELQKRLGLDRTEAQLISGGKTGMDLIMAFNRLFVPKKWRKSWRKQQHMKRLQKILDEY